MIYITQIIHVKAGQEDIFLEYEDVVVPLMQKYKGRVLHRIRPTKGTLIGETGKEPYEIHIVEFESQQGLDEYIKDPDRLKIMHLKENSVETELTIVGSAKS